MEILSKMADYGVTLMVAMAATPHTHYSAQSLADKTALPRPTVGNLLKKLAQAGLLHSQRGVNGGYGLAMAADKLSVAAIITAIDGKIGFTECSHDGDDPSNCSRAGICATRPHWQAMSRAVNHALAQVSLADMLPRAVDFTHPDFPYQSRSDNRPMKITTEYEALS
ncbi:MAG: SUF system Fe-S cluster assembly regulator [Alphaproteobacteria bacterium]|nr:SUF system Fe-S cluster assembly regulator [Alphaproteobacteria bacterium]